MGTGWNYREKLSRASAAKESELLSNRVRRYVRSIHLARRGREIFKVGAVQNFVRRYRVRWEKRFLPGRRTGSGDSNRHAVTEQGSDSPIIKAIWTLDTCAPIVGAEVKSFRDEQELLRDWGKFMRAVDPDMLIGYNIVNFDFPYLIKRANARRARFSVLGKNHRETTDD